MKKIDDIKIVSVGKGDPLIEDVKRLFDDLYAEFKRLGHKLLPVENGADKWVGSFEKTLNKYSVLLIALHHQKAVGLLHGFLKLLPAYLRGGYIGYVSYTFVSDDYRNFGVGEKLVEEAVHWFTDKGCSSVEVQVLTNNDSAIKFWEKTGFYSESLQLRRFLSPELEN